MSASTPADIAAVRPAGLAGRGALAAMILIALAIGGGTAVLRHWALLSSLIDLGVFEQALWTFMRTGEPITTISPPHCAYNWLGFHFSPILLPLAPLTLLPWAGEALMLVHATLIALTAVPVFLTARTLGSGERPALALAGLALVHPFAANAMAWDLHENAAAVLAIAWAIWAVTVRRYGLVWLCAVALVLVKEHYGLAVAGIGLLWWWRNGRATARAVPLIAFGLAAFALVLFVVMPQLSPGGAHPMLDTATTGSGGTLQRYGWIVLDPSRTFGLFWAHILTDPVTVAYLIVVFFGFAHFGLAGVLFLLPAAADLAANLLSAVPMPRHVLSYHSAPVLPAMLAAAAFGYARSGRGRGPLFGGLIGLNLLLSLLASPWPIPGTLDSWNLRGNLTFSPPAALTEVERMLPPELALSVQPNLGAHLARRPAVYPFPAGLERADAAALHLDYPFAGFDRTTFGNPYDGPVTLAALERLLADPDWRVALFRDRFLVLLHGPGPGLPKAPVHARIAEMRSAFGAH